MTAVAHQPAPAPQAWAPASLACMGVVFGDIGTSPLYALSAAAKAASPDGAITPGAVLGIVSLIFWSLIVVISIKYAILIMRADNHGEGGILALLALIGSRRRGHSRLHTHMLAVGLVGAALLYGDGAITPAISVLSAIEGIKVYAPHTAGIVVPLSVTVLVLLFLIQSRGTSFIGRIFGPIMLVWFVAIAVLGLIGIVKQPAILAALSPLPALSYLSHAGPVTFAVIGCAFLAVTGGEALYADMGHFGRLPIRAAWFGMALPALTLNYFGQGGLLLAQPAAIDNPFYQLAPQWLHYGLVLLATAATVIASQSIITGAFSLTQQAVQIGFLPRLEVVYTTASSMGQIYMPLVNWVLAAATLAAVIGFGSSDALAGAYGIAVSLLMAITTLLATFVALKWKFDPWIVGVVNGGLFLIDLMFFVSTSTKFLEGGWFPVLIALVIAFLMMTWRRGEDIMDAVRLEVRQSTEEFLAKLRMKPPLRIPGTAIVLGRLAQGIPLSLTQNLRHNRVLQERVLLVAITMDEFPRISDEERACVTPLSEEVTRVELHFGFMERLNVPKALANAAAHGKLTLGDPEKLTYYTGHETICAAGRRRMARWREGLFAFMNRNAQRPGVYFGIPASQIMEVGVEFEI